MIGKVLNSRYEILKEIPGTPFFANYVAKDLYRDVSVLLRVVKQPFASENTFLSELVSVVERSKALHHPHIARMESVDQAEGLTYIVGEHISGEPLRERMRRLAPFSPALSCEIAIAIAEALQAALGQGMVHGDLSSDTVMYDADGVVKVMDFGIWQCYSASETAPGIVLGRMAPYLAPEVIDGAMPSVQSDLYALGVLLFELLTGQRPYDGPTPLRILDQHRQAPVPDPRSLNPSVPRALSAIVQRALAKNPEERYRSPSEMLDDLLAVQEALRYGKPLEVRPQSPTVKSSLPRKPAGSQQPRGGASAAPPNRKRPTRDDDVPGWLRALIYLFAGMAIVIVGAFIYAQVNKKDRVIVPNLVGMPLSEARTVAQQAKLQIAVEDEEYDENYPEPQTVIRVSPAPGTPVYEGSEVRVVISLGSTRVEVPDLRGLTIAEARRQLDAVGLRLGSQVQYRSSSNTEKGKIIDSSPGPGQRIRRGSTVEVVLSTGSRPPDVPVGSTEELIPNTFSLTFRVPEGDGKVMVRVEMVDARAEPQVVFEEEREPGDEISLQQIEGFGDKATFRIYYNGVLDTEITRRGEGR